MRRTVAKNAVVRRGSEVDDGVLYCCVWRESG